MSKILNSLSKEKVAVGSTVLFILIITLFAWQSDDAYHGYVMARHLVEGYGFVYNIGERTTASTCPLFTLIVALGYFVFRNMFLVSLLINILFSTLAYVVVVKFFCKTKMQVALTFFTFVISSSFISYTTCGLENCLLFLLSALFLKEYLSKEKFNSRNLFYLAIILSLIAMTRMDMVLAFVPAIVFVYLFKRESCSFVKAAFIGLAGLFPFILWEAFATFYYGFPFPNTAYVKLGAGIPLSEYIVRGNEYLITTFLYDPLVVAVPVIAIVIAVLKKNVKLLVCVSGVLMYIGYLFCIGGDFMVGRLYTVIFFISTIVFLWFANDVDNKNVFIKGWLIITLVSLVLSISLKPYVNSRLFPNGPIADERDYYFPYTSLISNIRSYLTDGDMILWSTWKSKNCSFWVYLENDDNDRYLLEWAAGILVYEYCDDYYLNDVYALGDPFLSKLPAVCSPDWRVGHLHRDVPFGYYETVYYDENMIENESLREYYEIIRLITRGPLFSSERIRAIIDINTGKYDYLIDDYASTLDEYNFQLYE